LLDNGDRKIKNNQKHVFNGSRNEQHCLIENGLVDVFNFCAISNSIATFYRKHFGGYDVKNRQQRMRELKVGVDFGLTPQKRHQVKTKNHATLHSRSTNRKPCACQNNSAVFAIFF